MNRLNLLCIICFSILCVPYCQAAKIISTGRIEVKDIQKSINENISNATIPDNTTKSNFDPSEAEEYLVKYGYGKIEEIETVAKNVAQIHKPNEEKRQSKFKKMISRFQKFFGLKQTGKLDDATINAMKAPRCGVPDNVEDDSELGFRKFKIARKWHKKELTWKMENFTPDLGEKKTRKAFENAFNYWSEQAPLKFKETCASCKADISISFHYGDHGDSAPFDGQAGTLAHATFPEDGRVHFDEAELFVENSTNGFILEIVAAHEIGHALGIDHSNVRGSLMMPQYEYTPELKLHADDVLAIQSLYGKNFVTTKTTEITTQTTKTTTIKTTQPTTIFKPTTRPSRRVDSPKTTNGLSSLIYSEPCAESKDYMLTGPNNALYVKVRDGNFWRYDTFDDIWSKYRLQKVFPSLLDNVRGGVRCNKNFIWFFRDYAVWSYDGNKLRPKYPMLNFDKLYPADPTAAVNKNGKIYLLKKNLAYQIDLDTLKIIGSPAKIDQVFPGVPPNVEVVVKYGAYNYFIKNNYFYKFDEKKNAVIHSDKIISGFEPCRGYSLTRK